MPTPTQPDAEIFDAPVLLVHELAPAGGVTRRRAMWQKGHKKEKRFHGETLTPAAELANNTRASSAGRGLADDGRRELSSEPASAYG